MAIAAAFALQCVVSGTFAKARDAKYVQRERISNVPNQVFVRWFELSFQWLRHPLRASYRLLVLLGALPNAGVVQSAGDSFSGGHKFAGTIEFDEVGIPLQV